MGPLTWRSLPGCRAGFALLMAFTFTTYGPEPGLVAAPVTSTPCRFARSITPAQAASTDSEQNSFLKFMKLQKKRLSNRLAVSLASLKPKSKFGNKRCEINGEKYRSQKEAKRHQALLQSEGLGLIENLRREVRFELAPGVKYAPTERAKPALRYFADFVYDRPTCHGPVHVVEDCKGMRTDVYKIKKHLMATVHGIFIFES